MKGTQLMDIYSILSSKPHNPHHLNRCITFIEHCQQKNVGYEGYVERHHICPKADDMFPEYEDFKLHPWNCAVLTARQHFISHIMLSKAFHNINSQTYALWFMSNSDKCKIYSKTYETLRKKISRERKGKIVVRDKEGNMIRVRRDDPRYLSGELVSVNKDSLTVRDKEGNMIRVRRDDPRYLSGELVSVNKDSLTVRDKEGNVFRASKDDPRYMSGEIVSVLKGWLFVKDKEGKTFNVPSDDPRYILGELVFHLKGRMVAKDKEDNLISIETNDPRYLSGELVVFSKGTVVVRDKEGNVFRALKDDPRYLSGELVSISKGRLKGRKYYNNGIKNGMFIPGTEPKDFVPGRI
jgi:hypothetical protein